MSNKILEHKNFVIDNVKQYFLKTKINNAVIGLSGGVDSAVALSLLTESININNIFAYFIDIESNKQDYIDAKEIAEHLKVNLIYIDLTNSYNTLVKDFSQDNRHALGNIKSRLRALYLYDQAFNNKALVCGTSNYDELYLGYFTKFGDSANDLAILSGFLKRDVYTLAKYYDLPSCIIDKAPSAGLWENQTDEQEMGLKYKDIDNYLSFKEVSSDVVDKITYLHNINLHKLSYNYDMNKSDNYMELINGKNCKK